MDHHNLISMYIVRVYISIACRHCGCYQNHISLFFVQYLHVSFYVATWKFLIIEHRHSTKHIIIVHVHLVLEDLSISSNEALLNYFMLSFFSWSLQLAQTRDLATIDLQQILLNMRQQRLGLIQTADQLRFSYIAILQGALQDLELEPSNYDDLSDSDEDVPEEEDSDEDSDSELMKGIAP